MARHRVFVYGSLLSGLANHRMIGRPTTVFLGEGRTLNGGWSMMDMTHYPALFVDLDGPSVVGEVYEVDDETMSHLDRLEGYPGFYDRMEVMVTTEGGDHICWVYFLDNAEDLPRVPNNDWRTYFAARGWKSVWSKS